MKNKNFNSFTGSTFLTVIFFMSLFSGQLSFATSIPDSSGEILNHSAEFDQKVRGINWNSMACVSDHCSVTVGDFAGCTFVFDYSSTAPIFKTGDIKCHATDRISLKCAKTIATVRRVHEVVQQEINELKGNDCGSFAADPGGYMPNSSALCTGAGMMAGGYSNSQCRYFGEHVPLQ